MAAALKKALVMTEQIENILMQMMAKVRLSYF